MWRKGLFNGDFVIQGILSLIKSKKIGEAGVVSVGDTPVDITFNNTYNDPVVIVVPSLPAGTSRSGTTSAQVAMVYNVTSTGCSIVQKESSAGDGVIDVTDVAYIVLESGIYKIGDLLVEVGKTTSSGSYVTVTLNAPFTSTPAILASTQTDNNNTDVWARVKNVSTSSFDVQVETGDSTSPSLSNPETIGYVAIQQGFDDTVEVQSGTASASASFASVSLQGSYSSTPVVVATVDSENGSDQCYAVVRDVTTTGFQVAVEEPATKDGGHVTETLAYLVVPQDDILGYPYNEKLYVEGNAKFSDYVDILGNLKISGTTVIDSSRVLQNIASIAQTLTPSTDATYDLGSSSLRWNNGYFAGNLQLGTGTTNYIRLGSNLRIYSKNSSWMHVRNSDDSAYIGVACSQLWINSATVLTSTRKIQNIVSVIQNWIPDADATYDLGSSTARWRNGYFSGTLQVGSDIHGKSGYTGSVSLYPNPDILDTVNSRWYRGAWMWLRSLDSGDSSAGSARIHIVRDLNLTTPNSPFFDIYLLEKQTDGSATATKIVKIDYQGNLNLITGGLLVGGTTVINSSRVLQNVTTSRSIITDFFSSPFWSNIPDKPFEGLGSEFTTDGSNNLIVNSIDFSKIASRLSSLMTFDSSITPNADNSYDLGSSSYRFKKAYLGSFVANGADSYIDSYGLCIGNTSRRTSGEGLELYGPTSSAILSVQDGNGRIQLKWNATRGTNETFLVGGENAAMWEFDPVNPSTDLFRVRYTGGGSASAGDPITWNDVLQLGTGGLKVFYSGIYPGSDNSLNLGSSSLRFKNGYIVNLYADYVAKALIPSSDATYDLGSSTSRWNNGYFAGTLDTGSLNIGGTTVIDSSRVLQNVTTSRSIITDFFSSPFWDNIPDKPEFVIADVQFSNSDYVEITNIDTSDVQWYDVYFYTDELQGDKYFQFIVNGDTTETDYQANPSGGGTFNTNMLGPDTYFYYAGSTLMEIAVIPNSGVYIYMKYVDSDGSLSEYSLINTAETQLTSLRINFFDNDKTTPITLSGRLIITRKVIR